MANQLINPSFEDPWTNLSPVGNNLVNQQPAGWTITITKPGIVSRVGAGVREKLGK